MQIIALVVFSAGMLITAGAIGYGIFRTFREDN